MRYRSGLLSDDHDSVTDVLDDAGAERERLLDGIDELLDQIQRLLVARLLCKAHEPGEVRKSDRDPQLAKRPVEGRLHVGDHVLLDGMLKRVAVHVLHQGRRERKHLIH